MKRFKITDNMFALLLLLPALCVLLTMLAYPVVRGVWLSLCRCGLANINDPVWNNFKNYIEIFEDGQILEHLSITLRFVLLTVGTQVLLALPIALILNSRLRGRNLFRGMIFIAWTVPTIVVAIVFRWLFNSSYGVINWMIYKLGITETMAIPWTVDGTLAMALIVMACVWKQLPYMTVMLLAGLQSVDSSQLEAATVDGATGFQRLRHVILPALRPVMITSIWLSIVQNFQQFTAIKNITGGGPDNATMTLSLAVHQEAFKYFDFGTATAMGVVWMVLLTIVTVASNKMVDSASQDLL